MATKQMADYIVGQIREAGKISTLEMFGNFGICCDGKLVALVCDERLFIKPTDAGRAFLRTIAEVEPYADRRQCLLVPADNWADAAWLTQLFKLSLAELRPVAMKWER